MHRKVLIIHLYIWSVFWGNLLLGDQWDLRNRYLHITPPAEWKNQPPYFSSYSRIRTLSFLASVAESFFRCAALSGWLYRPWSLHSGSCLLRRGRCCPFLRSCRSAPVREYPTSAVCFSRKRIAWFLRPACRFG